MSNNVTRHMIPVYEQMAGNLLMFFAGMFQSPAINFHTSEEVEIDIERGDEEISIVITDLSTGYRMNSADIFTNKSFKPPIFKEAAPLNSFDLINRMPGDDPFQSPNFRANIITRMMNQMVKVSKKIGRSIELQASQVLQTGTITLTDSNGVSLYTIDFQPKATHFPDSSVKWGETNWDAYADIDGLAQVIRNDGLGDCDQLIFGADAFEMFQTDTRFIAQLDNRRMERGNLSKPDLRGNGGTWQGTVSIGDNTYDMWTYGARYNHPETGTKTRYMDPAKVIVRDSNGRLDATFGAIPNIGKALGAQPMNLLPEFPGRFSMPNGGMDLFTNVWVTPDGEQIFGGVGARPLMIPTAIDTFGCLDTQL